MNTTRFTRELIIKLMPIVENDTDVSIVVVIVSIGLNIINPIFINSLRMVGVRFIIRFILDILQNFNPSILLSASLTRGAIKIKKLQLTYVVEGTTFTNKKEIWHVRTKKKSLKLPFDNLKLLRVCKISQTLTSPVLAKASAFSPKIKNSKIRLDELKRPRSA